MEEKRKYPRFTVDVEVHWKKIAGPDERMAQHISHVKDASLGGICLVLHPGIVPGDTLLLEIFLPGQKCIRSKGKVMWVNPQTRIKGRTENICEGGIEFLDTSDADRKEIGYFLSQSYDTGGHK